jgi:hypothetical protein
MGIPIRPLLTINGGVSASGGESEVIELTQYDQIAAAEVNPLMTRETKLIKNLRGKGP